MTNSINTSFSYDDQGISSVTFGLIPRNEMVWGTCSLSLSEDGKLGVTIVNNFQDTAVVFGQVAMLAKALGVEATSLTLSVRSTPSMDQGAVASLLPNMVRDIGYLVKHIERYFIEAAHHHFDGEMKECVVKNRHVYVRGSTGSFSIPFTLLIKILTDSRIEPIESELVMD